MCCLDVSNAGLAYFLLSRKSGRPILELHSDLSLQGPSSSPAPNVTLEESENRRLEDASDPVEPLKQPQSEASDDNTTDFSSHDDERDGHDQSSQQSASDHDEAAQVSPLTQ